MQQEQMNKHRSTGTRIKLSPAKYPQLPLLAKVSIVIATIGIKGSDPLARADHERWI